MDRFAASRFPRFGAWPLACVFSCGEKVLLEIYRGLLRPDVERCVVFIGRSRYATLFLGCGLTEFLVWLEQSEAVYGDISIVFVVCPSFRIRKEPILCATS